MILEALAGGQPGALSRQPEALGIRLRDHDVRFVEDDWESPTIGAWGLGWEVWLDGMEVSQFTYFQQVGGIECDPVSTELTYGLERLAMFVQGVESVYDLDWNGRPKGEGGMTYGDVYLRSEREFSAFNFEATDPEILFRHFEDAEKTCASLLARQPQLALPAYDQCLKASTSSICWTQGRHLGDRAPGLYRPRPDLGEGLLRAWLRASHPSPRRAEPWPNSCSSFCPRKSPRACRRAPPTICAVSSATS